MTQKIIVSKPTYNALTETNPNNLIFSSDYNTLKYYMSGSFSIDIDLDADETANEISLVAHNLGFTPFFTVFVKHQTNWIPMCEYYVTAGYGFGNGVYRAFTTWVTNSNLYVKVFSDADGIPDSYTAYFKYKIFRNNLGL